MGLIAQTQWWTRDFHLSGVDDDHNAVLFVILSFEGDGGLFFLGLGIFLTPIPGQMGPPKGRFASAKLFYA